MLHPPFLLIGPSVEITPASEEREETEVFREEYKHRQVPGGERETEGAVEGAEWG